MPAFFSTSTRWWALPACVFAANVALTSVSGCTVTVNGKRQTVNPLDWIPKGDDKKEAAADHNTSKPAPAAKTANAAKADDKGAAPTVEPAPPPKDAVHVVLDKDDLPADYQVKVVGPTMAADQSMYKSPFKSCSNSISSYMTSSPGATLEVTKATKLRVFSHHDVLIAFPNDTFRCIESRTIGNHVLDFGFIDAEPGTYKVYAAARKGNSARLALDILFFDELPGQVNAEVAARTPVVVDGKAPLNPNYAAIDLGKKVQPLRAAWLGVQKCGRAHLGDVVPVTTVDVKEVSTYSVTTNVGDAYLLSEDGSTCHSGRSYELKEGKYRLWVRSRQAVSNVEVAVVNNERRLAFADAPHVKVGDLKRPTHVAAEVQAPAYRAKSLCGAGARTPSFYLDVKKALPEVQVRRLLANDGVDMTVIGPLESNKRFNKFCQTSSAYLKPESRSRYSSDKSPKRTVKGTYAVWVWGPKERVGEQAYVNISSPYSADNIAYEKAKGDPLFQLGKASAKKDLGLQERQIWWHFPYYDRSTSAVEPLFMKAPTSLFVFLDRDVNGIAPSEPLLLVKLGDDKSEVLRATGERVHVRSQRLTTEVPQKVTAPAAFPDLKKPKKIGAAKTLALPQDKVAFAKWKNLDDKLYSCVGRYMKKHDPSWGKDYDVINTRTGENISDVYFRKADKACGAKKVERAAQQVITKTFNNRKKAQKQVKSKLARRFK